MKKKFKDRLIGRILTGIIKNKFVKNTLQTIPVIGTLVTAAMDEDTVESPQGKLQLNKWHIYRILVGLVIGFVLYRGWLTTDMIDWIMGFVSQF